ncbi:MAG: Hpt domain-containing protein [Desulfoferrobacter sp.]
MNLADKAKSLGFEEVELREMLELFIEISLSDLQKLQSAVDQKKPELAAAAAHSIKGAARSFGFDELAGKLEIVELRARGNDVNLDGELLTSVQRELDEIIETLRTADLASVHPNTHSSSLP